MNIILALDFDQTIADSEYPKIIGLRKNAKKVINKLYEEGFHIIIWTCRSAEAQEQVVEFLNKEEVKYHQINEHHPYVIDVFKNNCRKIACDILVDDTSLLGIPDDWDEIYIHIHRRAEQMYKKNRYYLKDLK